MANEITDQYDVIRRLKQSKGVRTQVVRKEGEESPEFVIRVLRRDTGKKGRNDPPWHINLRHPNFAPTIEVGCTNRGEIYILRDFYKKSAHVTTTPDFINGMLSIALFLEKHSLIHGAIKPSNLFWNGEILTLTDPSFWAKPPAAVTAEDILYTVP